jgi:lipid-binding SYLF domain-containing protein
MQLKRVRLAVMVGFLLAGLGLGRLAYAAETDAQLVADCGHTIALYRQKDPGIDEFFARSVAYLVFPSIGKGGLGIGAAHGTGILFQRGAPVGKVSMNQVSIGAQAGGQEFSQIIFYQTEDRVAELKAGKAQLAGNLSAVALSQGAAATAKFKNGVAVFTATKGGQKFSYAAF